MVLAAHSSNDNAPLPFVSSLAKALRLAPSTSSDSIFPSLFLSAREKRFSSRLLELASGAWSGPAAEIIDALKARGAGAAGRADPPSARDCQMRKTPVMKRKQAAAPAKKRSKANLL